MSKVIVAGGGPAGMMAAIAAADNGHDVTLVEKNEKLGKKLFITGKGRCNVTNYSEVEDLLKNVMRNPKFLYSAFYTLDSESLFQFFESEGLKLKVERGNRVFPESDKSSDVIRTLEKALKKRNVSVKLHTKVIEILCEKDAVSKVCIEGKKGETEELSADNVVVATGGISYPSTGSTGDGYLFAETTGHRLIERCPSLVPFALKEKAAAKMQGLSLRNAVLTVRKGQKVLFQEMGEMLFTHFGISGPLVLSASSVISGMSIEDITISIDLKPALSHQQLDERILRDFAACQNSYFKNSLGKLLPAKMVPVVVELSQIPPEQLVNEITREQRTSLVNLLKEMTFHLENLRGYPEAIITRGGVCVKDINPGTMESKKVKGLYFAGEVLDLDARTGGYNLQIAWSTGYLAGISME